jgi:stage III sporulation protein AG
LSKEKQKTQKKFKIEYLLVIFLALLALFIFFSSTNLDFGLNFSKENTQGDKQSTLENKLQEILTNIDGVGKTLITINLDGSSEEIVLKNVETVSENGSTIKSESVVLVNGKPYVLKELSPKILGVVVVCEGANNISVKMAITEVLTTILEVSSDNIRILKMK